jgi:glycerol-3-phosphate dehydrogenase
MTLAAALMINDLMSYDRNRLKDGGKHIPGGRTISRSECLGLLPGVTADGITGGALWYDAQIYNSERLLLSFVLAAAEAGAEVANYVEATGFLQDDMTVTGVRAKDVLTGEEVEIRAKLVVNSAGAWVDSLLSSLNNHAPAPKLHLSTALNLVTRQVLTEYAVGITGRYTSHDKHGNPIQRSRMLFITPWRRYSIIGTIHALYAGRPDDFRVTEEVIEQFIGEINAAYPGAALTPQDVYHVHLGFLPMTNHGDHSDVVKLVRQSQIYDHERDDGIKGLITVVGVKYTTARDVAQKVVDLAVEKLGRKTLPCQTHITPIYGGHIERFGDFMTQTIQEHPFRLAPEVTQHLAYSYGSEYYRVLKYLGEEPTWGQTIGAGSSVLKAEVVHAVREEMAQKLTDVVQRRTELGAAGLPDEATLHVCADLMANELGWGQARKEREVDEVRAAYAPVTALMGEDTGVN